MVNHHQAGRRTTRRRRSKQHKTEKEKQRAATAKATTMQCGRRHAADASQKKENRNNRKKTKPAAAAEPPGVAFHGLAQGGPEKRIPDKGNCCSRGPASTTEREWLWHPYVHGWDDSRPPPLIGKHMCLKCNTPYLPNHHVTDSKQPSLCD